MKALIVFLISLSPTMVEVYKDRDGDSHPNNDWKWRFIMCEITAASLSLLYQESFIEFLIYIAIAGLLFAAIFPYWINFVHLKRGITSYQYAKTHVPYVFLTKKEVIHHCMNHLSDSAWPDKTFLWKAIGPWGRLAVSIIFIALVIFIYTL